MKATDFQAAGWLKHRHLQTIFPTLMRQPPALARQREVVNLSDDDCIELDWHDIQAAQALVIVLHGLSGSTDSLYVPAIQHALAQRGIGSVALNFRGAGGRHNRRARNYHGGDTADLAAVVSLLATRFPGRRLGAVGYSLGGNVLLKWLGEQGNDAGIRAACAVSAPYDLATCSVQLNRGFARVYRNRLIGDLTGDLIAKEQVLRQTGRTSEADLLKSLGDLRRIRTFREYDGGVIAALHGFADADDYYRRSSCRQFLPRIRRPTLLVHALDDPFMTPDVVPGPDECPEGVERAFSARGGHVGFVAGTPWRPHYWVDGRVADFLQAQLAR